MKHVEYTSDELEVLTEVWNTGSVSLDTDASASKQQAEIYAHHYHFSNGLIDTEYKPNVYFPYLTTTWSNKQ